jgi:hypothetical protein
MTLYERALELDQNDAHRWFTANIGGHQQAMTLSGIMDFDRVIEVLSNGSITDDNIDTGHSEFWAPVLTDGKLECYLGTEWVLFGASGDMSGDHIMNPAEFIGGHNADHIVSHPGFYVAILANHTCNDECEEKCDDVEGWALAMRVSR